MLPKRRRGKAIGLRPGKLVFAISFQTSSLSLERSCANEKNRIHPCALNEKQVHSVVLTERQVNSVVLTREVLHLFSF